MLWFDSVLAVPVLGYRTSPSFREAMTGAPALAAYAQARAQCGSLSIRQGRQLDASVQLPNGLSVSTELDKIVARFQYPQEPVPAPGRFAQLAQPALRPYSELLRACCDEAMAYVELLHVPSLALRWVGVVAMTTLDPAALPPGVDLFLEHLGRPWNHRAQSVSCNLLVDLERSDERHVRCAHSLVFDTESPSLGLQLTLDWQELFTPERPFQLNALAELNQRSTTAALAYFQRFGEGDFDYATA